MLVVLLIREWFGYVHPPRMHVCRLARRCACVRCVCVGAQHLPPRALPIGRRTITATLISFKTLFFYNPPRTLEKKSNKFVPVKNEYLCVGGILCLIILFINKMLMNLLVRITQMLDLEIGLNYVLEHPHKHAHKRSRRACYPLRLLS